MVGPACLAAGVGVTGLVNRRSISFTSTVVGFTFLAPLSEAVRRNAADGGAAARASVCIGRQRTPRIGRVQSRQTIGRQISRVQTVTI